VPKSPEKQRVIVYWLTPANAERALFGDIISILSKQFAAPNFDPHLTLLAATEDGQSPEQVLQNIDARPISLAALDVAFSAEFRKTLFVRLESNPLLQDLVIDLARAVSSPGKQLVDPHISLLYKSLSPEVQKELATTIKLPVQTVTFDSIAAVRSISPIANGADVEAWEVLVQKSFSQ
jgi:hypothetical protein